MYVSICNNEQEMRKKLPFFTWDLYTSTRLCIMLLFVLKRKNECVEILRKAWID